MNSKIAIRIILLLLVTIILFHISIVLRIVPYEITWGGRLKSDAKMYVFEAISILINLLLGGVLLVKGKYISQVIPLKYVNIILWVFLILFLLNTIGNVFAKTSFEKFFSILTLGMSYLIWVILVKDKKLNPLTEN